MCVSTQCHTHKSQSDRSRTKKKLSVVYFRAWLLLHPTILKTAHTCYFTGTWFNTVRVHFKRMTCNCPLWKNKTLRIAWFGWRQLGTSARCCSVLAVKSQLSHQWLTTLVWLMLQLFHDFSFNLHEIIILLGSDRPTGGIINKK